ncbi:MAG: TIR domain-containing protein [Nitrospira sp.]|nr:MAG: TIR domain-containing protein [Nitrospira sp.]
MSNNEPNPNAEHFDVFLCHNSEDKAEIRQIADELSRRGLKPWLDELEIRPGQLWQVALEEQIKTIKAAAVFVGKSGISPWQQMEVRSFLNQFVKRACPIIPVILSSATGTPELPIFLQNFHWVDFRKNHPDPYEQLINGIAGKKSGPEMEKASASVLLDPGQDNAEERLHSPIANPPDQRQQEQLGILRDRVQEYWVDGVLRQSLYHEVLISLGKRTMDEAVERPPWKCDLVDLPSRCRDVLPQDYTINTVFDATGLLLILGEPGSGKTTSLLELAAVLINRAKDDPKERVPIVLNLSSWQKKQSLEEWIAAELSAKYRIPVKIARAWLVKGYLVPLLDGLDEVQPAIQPDCVAAINAFIETHNSSGMVVCSRWMEYHWLPRKLKMNGAVCLEPLSLDDVNNFLAAGGPQLAGLQQVMNNDPVLQELAQTPLMLSVMSLACEGADGKALMSPKDDSPQARREHIFQLYVERMFQRKKSITSRFSQDEAIRWLSWLARKMKEQSQSVFMVEALQPQWLSLAGQQFAYEAVAALSSGLLVVWLIVILNLGSSLGLYEVLIPGLAYGLVFAASIIVGCHWASPWKNIAVTGLVIGIFFGLFEFRPSVLVIGSLGGLLAGAGIQSLKEIHLVETMGWQTKRFRAKAITGLISGWLFGELYWLVARLVDGVRDGFVYWLSSGVMFGLLFGLISGLLFGLVDSVRANKSSPNQGIIFSLKNGLVALAIGLLIFGPVGLLSLYVKDNWLTFPLFFGLLLGLNRGGSAVLKHYALRLVLWLTGATPFRFIPFLDHCAKLILLKKVGGGYMFIHRSLLEYFAALPPEGNTVKKSSPCAAS